MGQWKTRNSQEPYGQCHVCKAPANGPHHFQTRFCIKCFSKGMELDGSKLMNSPYAIIHQLHRIQTHFNEVVSDTRTAINSFLPGTPIIPDKEGGRVASGRASKLKSEGVE